MDAYSRLIFFSMLACGFGPVSLLVIYCLLTGRSRLLFSKKPEADQDHSMVLTILFRLTLWLLPVYLILLTAFVGLSLR
jgi:hypothetical protein